MIVFDHMASLENHKKPCVLIIDLGGVFLDILSCFKVFLFGS